ncbi:MAG: hypothetical protein MJ231_08170 [bacterium]|nr:hypothetical protein [bacterium]
MKKLLTTIFILSLLTITAQADDKQEALNFFNNYVKQANSYSDSITKMYTPNAKIIRQVVKPDGTTADAVTDTTTYIKQMRISQSIAKMRHYTNAYSNVTVTALGNGSYKISSLRTPMQDKDKLKTYMIIKKQPNGQWLITEEMMQTKQQIFLRYAK